MEGADLKHLKSITIAVVSGKGGTGKTTIATNLAKVLVSEGMMVRLLDTDVEAPNSRLFLNFQNDTQTPVYIAVPEVDHELCTLCGKCGKICEFHAIGVFGKQVLVFPELCHSCGGCARICPEGAIQEINHEMGRLSIGKKPKFSFVEGRLNIGEAKAPPLIHAVKENLDETGINIIDAPPGTSCPMVASIQDSDFVLLVTDPTPFGLHDLKLAAAVTKKLNLPAGVVINRSTLGNGQTREFCEQENLPVLMEIPESRKIAEAYASGRLLVDVLPEYQQKFQQLFTKISQGVAQ
jgi:MinD superfamily P-loop ATPase